MKRREFLGALAAGLAGKDLSFGQQNPEQKNNLEEFISPQELRTGRQDAADLQKLIEDPQVPALLNNIQKQLETFKPPQGHMFDPGYNFRHTFEKIKDLLGELSEVEKEIAELQTRIKEEEKEEYKKSDKHFMGFFEGFRNRYLKGLRAFHEYVFPSQEKKHSLPKQRILGFDSLAGWSDKKISGVIKSFPPELFSGVDKIEFIDQVESRETFRVAGSAGGESDFNMDALSRLGQKNRDIKLYKGLENYDRWDMEEVLVHEAGHNVDWERSAKLNFKQRLEFFNESLELYRSYKKTSDKYPDSMVYNEYLADIKKNPDEPTFYLLTSQVTEYWADLVYKYTKSIQDYKRSPEDFVPEISEAEYFFVEKWLKVQGIDFGYKV